MAKKSEIKRGKGGLKLRGLVWVSRGSAAFLGQGRVALLEKIKEYGSISEAAKSMDMSYKHAWDLVDSINKQSEKPLVVKATGGKGGGGAQLTAEGENAVKVYWAFYNDFMKFLKTEEKKLKL